MSYLSRMGVAILAVASILGGLLASPTVVADTTTVTPRGEYAQIDTRLADETIRVLTRGSAEERHAITAKIKANPENYAPPVFYLLSHVLFTEGEKELAAFWFYAGQLRARVDANICADQSARQAVAVLNENFGTPINQYAFQDIPRLEALIPKVVEWERRTPYNYDRRWINLTGMGAIMSGISEPNEDSPQAPLSHPKEKWDEIAEITRTGYLSGFKAALNEIKNQE